MRYDSYRVRTPCTVILTPTSEESGFADRKTRDSQKSGAALPCISAFSDPVDLHLCCRPTPQGFTSESAAHESEAGPCRNAA